MTTKHTPGPWKVSELEPTRVITSDFSMLAECKTFGSDTLETDKANARLIAAAPELLAAAEILSKSWVNPVGQRMLLDAIAKAKGQ